MTLVENLLAEIKLKIGSDAAIPYMVPVAPTLPGAGGPLVRTLAGHTNKVVSVDALGTDPTQIISGSDDGTAKLWDLETGAEIRSFDGDTRNGCKESLTAARMIAGDKFVATSSWDKSIRIWETGSGLRVCDFRGHELVPNCMVQCKGFGDKVTIASGDNEGAVKIWIIVDNGADLYEPLATLKAKSWILCMCFRENRSGSPQLITGSTDGDIVLWDLASEKILITYAGHTGSVNSVVLCPDNQYIITASRDNSARLWKVDNQESIRTFDKHRKSVTKAVASNDMQYIVTASEDRTLALFNLQTGNHLRTFIGHARPVTDVCITTDQRYIVSSSEDQTLKVWHFQVQGVDDKDLPKTACHLYDVTALATYQDSKGHFVMSASNDRTAKTWSTEGIERNSLVECGILTGIDISPDGKQCVTSSWDKRANVWDLATGNINVTMYDSGGVVTCCIFHPDGRRIITGGTDNTVKVWCIDTEDLEKKPFSKHSSAVSSLAIFPDGRFFVSGSHDCKAVLWDLDCNMDMWEYVGHEDKVNAVAVMPDDSGVLTASSDCTARLWSREAPTQLRCYGEVRNDHSVSLTGHDAAVTGVAVSKDCVHLVTSSEDCRAILWNVRTAESLCQFDMETSVLCCAIMSVKGEERVILGGANGRMMFLRITGSKSPNRKTSLLTSAFTMRKKPQQQFNKRKLTPPKKTRPLNCTDSLEEQNELHVPFDSQLSIQRSTTAAPDGYEDWLNRQPSVATLASHQGMARQDSIQEHSVVHPSNAHARRPPPLHLNSHDAHLIPHGPSPVTPRTFEEMKRKALPPLPVDDVYSTGILPPPRKLSLNTPPPRPPSLTKQSSGPQPYPVGNSDHLEASQYASFNSFADDPNGMQYAQMVPHLFSWVSQLSSPLLFLFYGVV